MRNCGQEATHMLIFKYLDGTGICKSYHCQPHSYDLLKVSVEISPYADKVIMKPMLSAKLKALLNFKQKPKCC